MNYFRQNDENCFRLSKSQSLIFEKASLNGIPSYFFVKVFFNSKYGRQFDDLSILYSPRNEQQIYIETEKKVKMRRGSIIPAPVMAWIGYLLREWSYLYAMPSTALLKIVSLDYLTGVYNPYHSQDIRKAIELILKDKKVDLDPIPLHRTIKILEEITA